MENGLDAEVRRKGELVDKFIKEEICPMDSRLSYRGIGLLWGIDFGAFPGDPVKALVSACFRNGVIAERVGRDNSVLKMMPALTISDELLLEGLRRVKNAIAEIL